MMSSPVREAAPAPLEAKPLFDWLFGVAVLAVIAVYIRAIYFTPLDALQGAAQKIYYVHVPSAIGAYLAVSITALMSIVYLWLREERADRLAEASAEVGLIFLTVVLITGPIWARWIWGTWWAWWDARLTLTLFLWFVVAAYLVLRGGIDDAAMRARYSAVLGILGALLIPFIHLSVYFFNTLHPMPIALKPGRPNLSGEMLTTFLLGMCAFALLAIALVRARYRFGVQRDMVAALEAEGTI
jgi:heme exporter protein C